VLLVSLSSRRDLSGPSPRRRRIRPCNVIDAVREILPVRRWGLARKLGHVRFRSSRTVGAFRLSRSRPRPRNCRQVIVALQIEIAGKRACAGPDHAIGPSARNAREQDRQCGDSKKCGGRGYCRQIVAAIYDSKYELTNVLRRRKLGFVFPLLIQAAALQLFPKTARIVICEVLVKN